MANLQMLEHQLPAPDLKERLTKLARDSSIIAENIAVGSTPQSSRRLDEFTGHRKNHLDRGSPPLESQQCTGRVFRGRDFSQLGFRELSVEQQEQKVVLCSQRRDSALRAPGGSGERAKAMQTQGEFRKIDDPFEASDLSKLPGKHRAKNSQRPYSKIAVGDAAANAATGFSHYRIAVTFLLRSEFGDGLSTQRTV